MDTNDKYLSKVCLKKVGILKKPLRIIEPHKTPDSCLEM